MSTPPTFHLRDLGPEAQAMARNCKNERLAMTLQYVALGSMIVNGRRCSGSGFERRLRLARSWQVTMTRPAQIRGTRSRESPTDGS
jgi:hypothetical protein